MFNAMRKMRWVVIIMLTCCFMWVIDVDRWRIVFEVQRAEAAEIQAQQVQRDMRTDFDTKLGEMQSLLELLANEVKSDSATEATYTQLMAKKEALLVAFKETWALMDEMDTKLVRLGLESKITRLHQVQDELYSKNGRVFSDLLTIELEYKGIEPVLGLYTTDEIADHRVRLVRICQELASFLSQNRQEPLHQPLGRDLPHGGMTFEPVTPTLGTESSGLVAGGRIQLPTGVERFSAVTSADLASTPEIQINDKIRALAASLHHNPREIYYHVLNNYDFQPYYGSLKGSEGVRLEGIGNDIDLASFTMALLRASNVPCRYVYGLVEIPIESVMSWLMVEKPEVAVEMLQTKTGIPTAVRMEGNKIVSVQIEHVWVEALIHRHLWLDSDPSVGENRWVPMDASFKMHNMRWGRINYVNFQVDYKEQIATALKSELESESIDYVQNINTDTFNLIAGYDWEHIFGDVNSIDTSSLFLGDERISIVNDTSIMPMAIQNNQRILRVDKIFSAIPRILCHSITFTVMTNESSNENRVLTAELQGSPIVIGAQVSSNDDKQLLLSILTMGDSTISLPGYLFSLSPTVTAGTEVLVKGNAMAPGSYWDFKMSFDGPNFTQSIVVNRYRAGDIAGVNINCGKVGNQGMAENNQKYSALISSLNNSQIDGVVSNNVLGEALCSLGLYYWKQLEVSDDLKANQMRIIPIRGVSEIIIGMNYDYGYQFGIPGNLNFGGLFVDVDRCVIEGISVVGDKNKAAIFNYSSGICSSILEREILDQFTRVSNVGYSTIDLLRVANEQGKRIFLVTKENISMLLPQLNMPSYIISDVQIAIGNGYSVIIPESQVSVGNSLLTGYVIKDPATGNAGFYVSEGLSGAIASMEMLVYWGMSTGFGYVGTAYASPGIGSGGGAAPSGLPPSGWATAAKWLGYLAFVPLVGAAGYYLSWLTTAGPMGAVCGVPITAFLLFLSATISAISTVCAAIDATKIIYADKKLTDDEKNKLVGFLWMWTFILVIGEYVSLGILSPVISVWAATPGKLTGLVGYTPTGGI